MRLSKALSLTHEMALQRIRPENKNASQLN